MIGKKEVTIVIKYVCDYSNGISTIDDVKVGTTAKDDIVEYPTLLGILDMAKNYIHTIRDIEEE